MSWRLGCINIQHLLGSNLDVLVWQARVPVGFQLSDIQTALLPQFIMTKLIGFAAFFMFTSIGQAQARKSAAVKAMPKHPAQCSTTNASLYEAEQARKRRVLFTAATAPGTSPGYAVVMAV